MEHALINRIDDALRVVKDFKNPRLLDLQLRAIIRCARQLRRVLKGDQK